MITSIKGVLDCWSSSYNILTDENSRKEFENQKAIAADYLRRNPKPKLYCITGRDLREEMEHTDFELSCLLPFSDEEVAHIKELLVQTYNEESDVCKTFEEICANAEREELYGLEGMNAELDELLFEPCHDCNVNVERIDFENPHHLYTVTICYYKKGCYDTEPIKDGEDPTAMVEYEVRLSDEDYLTLLAWQLYNPPFNFNRMMLVEPKIAQNIVDQVEQFLGQHLFQNDHPFFVLLDELKEDAARILKEKK